MCEVDVESDRRVIRVCDASYEMVKAIEMGLSCWPVKGSEFVMETLEPRQRSAFSGVYISLDTGILRRRVLRSYHSHHQHLARFLCSVISCLVACA